MDKIPDKISFPKEEEAVLAYWQKIDAFQTSLKRSEGLPEFSFYDGPPFATGLPHYGHILAGTIKDTVTRYAHQTGHHVTRRFGWDCHGLPIEFEIDKILGIKTRDDVLALPGGIKEYNTECRKIVMRYSSEWERIVSRLGRWIDFKNDYKSLDINFMESVWWVFSQLYNEKKLVYRGFKVMPYSTRCSTPLSNFEANMDYRDVNDPAVVVKFQTEDDPEVNFVAWTTTPWTLPSNLALAVNPNLTYVKVKDVATNQIYILCKNRLESIFPKKKVKGQPQQQQGGDKPGQKKGGPPQNKRRKQKTEDKPGAASEEQKEEEKDDRYVILQTYKGSELEGMKYIPLFDYFASEKANGAFKVITGDFVTDDSGTGVVHCAPAFGEEDYNACLKFGVINKGEAIPCPVDDSGRFTSIVTEFAGVHVKEADAGIMDLLKKRGRIAVKGTISHSYPFCWRSDTPLIYKAVPSWFVNVESLRDKLLANNDSTYWVPDFVKTKRFHNWLADAKDWAVSRNRFWGTPIPIWQNPADPEERICVGSVAELEKLTGQKITDLHREFLDDLTIPAPSGNGVLKRVEEVFDCWFESGSMPYAQVHYPFENEDLFKKSFPADFIAEGIDQTRGWFYTLLVLSTALFDKPAWKNLIVNGMVLASDGKKMSKRLKNYPEPTIVVDNYGADSVRLYLITSAVVKGEDLRFMEKGVNDVRKDVFLPWFNSFRFFAQSLEQRKLKTNLDFVPDLNKAISSTNVMDKWILSALQSLLKFVKKEMEGYRLFTVVPKLLGFIGQLTNWYIRFNRKRLKGREGDDEDQLKALNALFETLLTMSIAMGPFAPFFSEYVYQYLKKLLPSDKQEDSVHYLMFPDPKDNLFDENVERKIEDMQMVIELGRYARDKRTLPIRNPLKEITIVTKDENRVSNLKDVERYISEELNVRKVTVTSDEGAYVQLKAEPVRGLLGKRLRGDALKVYDAIRALTHASVTELRTAGKLTVLGHEIEVSDVTITQEFNGDKEFFEATWTENALVVLDLHADEDMEKEKLAREIINRLQKLRKEAGLNVGDPVETFCYVDPAKDKLLASVPVDKQEFLVATLLLPLLPVSWRPPAATEIVYAKKQIGNTDIEFWITKSSFSVDADKVKAIAEKAKGKEAVEGAKGDRFVAGVSGYLNTRLYDSTRKNLEDTKQVQFELDGVSFDLKLGEDVFLSAAARREKAGKW